MKKEKTVVYTNPVGGMTDIGDPFVLKDGNQYYMFATSAPSIGFRVWQSDNMVDWEDKGLAYDINEQMEQWATGDFWAPEVMKHNGKFYMTYSARNHDGHLQISVAVSDNPLGPFKDVSTEIVNEDGSYIDGHIFAENNTAYFYYVKDCSENVIEGNHVSQIFVQRMNDDLTRLIGKPKLLLEPDQDWEGLGGDYQWNEGPFLLKDSSRYYLMYSANYFASEDYGVGYAVADNPLGPFKKAQENPVLTKDLEHGISGPGHNSVAAGLNGKTLYTFYHTHTYPQAPSGDRQMNMDRLYFEDGKLKIDGPSYSEQTITVTGGN